MSRYIPLLLFALGAFLSSFRAGAQQLSDFTLRGSGDEIEIQALGEDGSPAAVRGTYRFSVNGLQSSLDFRQGVAALSEDVSVPTLLYVKHRGEESSRSKLFYVYGPREGGMQVLHIPLALLVLVPLALVFVGMIFRKLILLALLLLAAFFYFNQRQGLSFESFFDAAGEWLKSLF